ncbi:MAG: DUF6295 family protein [Caldilineaceae bacterium]
MAGSGKGAGGWFTLDQAYVSFDHPFNARGARAQPGLRQRSRRTGACRGGASLEAARELVATIQAVMAEAEAGGYTDAPSGTVAVTAGSNSG